MMNKSKNLVDIFVVFLLILLFFVYIFCYQIPKQKSTPTYQILLNDADGLIVGSPVLFAGKNVGRVINLKFQDNQTFVKFILTHKEMTKIPDNSEIRIKASGLASSKSLEIYQNKALQDENIVVKGAIRQVDLDNVQVTMSKQIINTANSLTTMLPNEKLHELKKFAKTKFQTDQFLEIFDKIIETEDKFQDEINHNKLKDINKKLER